MVEIVQDDREAAASVAVLVEMRELIRSGRADYHAEPFAKHRLAERARIVAWLRDNMPSSLADLNYEAGMIEAGEHLVDHAATSTDVVDRET